MFSLYIVVFSPLVLGGIIYAPGHEPGNTTNNGHFNLTKSRIYDVDVIHESVTYVIVAGITTILGFSACCMILFHTCVIRDNVAQEAYNVVYPMQLRRFSTTFTTGGRRPDLRGVKNLYMNGKIVAVMRIFALALVAYQGLVMLGPPVMPMDVVCTPDPMWVSLVHLPINVVAVGMLFYAVFRLEYHAVLLHSVVTMYATVYFCSTLIGLASSHEPLCVQSIATQCMFAFSAWIFFWPPKIAGVSSLRDRLAYEKMILKEHDKAELEHMREVTHACIVYSSSEEDLEDPVRVDL
jgi:hypothetical protein